MEHVWKPQQKENCILGDPKTRLIWHLNNFPRTQTCALMFFLKGCILIHDKTQQLKKIPSNMQDEQILISSGLSSTECCSYHYWPRPCPLCNSPHKAIKYTARYFLFISELDVKVKNRKKIQLKKEVSLKLSFFNFQSSQFPSSPTNSIFQPRQSFYQICNVTHQQHFLHLCSSQQRAWRITRNYSYLKSLHLCCLRVATQLSPAESCCLFCLRKKPGKADPFPS